ncbi:MAG TPA: hypothetical protein VFV05_24740 [Methylomirabilota bacterium]|nr:hypothetical protein [Methylomirabilota bacterium]
MAGSGNVQLVYMAPRPMRFVFTQNQAFKEGATLFVLVPDGGDGTTMRERYTIERGGGTLWQAHQHGQGSITSGTYGFRTSDPSNSRLRRAGGEGTEYVPGAKHFLYVAPIAGSGNPDWYTYVDTLFPENGVHPYTKDHWTGQMWLTNNDVVTTVGKMVPDAAHRVSAVDSLPPVLSR